MATVLVAGAYGQRNPGDDALLTAFVEALRAHRAIATRADPALTPSPPGCDASARILAEAGAPAPFRVGADATWASLARASLATPRAEDSVLVAVSRFAESGDFAVALADGLRELRAQGLTICLQPWQLDGSG